LTDIVLSVIDPTIGDPGTGLSIREEIFVFGSNEAGIHGAGAALTAHDHFGAVMKQGFGPMGKSFGVPTCSKPTNKFDRTWVISPNKIQYYVYCFILYAKMNPQLDFKVTRLGTGYVGIKDEHMAPLFTEAPDNCSFDEAWKPWLPNAKFWGTF
jgi:hypothetical protein